MSLELQQIAITLENQPLLDDLTLTVNPGDVFSLMGPSGCGKSTLLSFIAGTLGKPFIASGEVRLNGQSLSALPVEARNVGILFQDPLLFPHMTVLENLIFAARSGNHTDKRHAALSSLQTVQLEQYANQYPNQLSGGQAARVSLMRTLIAEPDALLLDEPFSKLDKQTRCQFRSLVFGIIAQRKIPAVLVTHDEDDVADSGQMFLFPGSRSNNSKQ